MNTSYFYPLHGPEIARSVNKQRKRKLIPQGQWDIGFDDDILMTYGIGFGIGIILWDRWNDLAGMIHLEFPEVTGNECHCLCHKRPSQTCHPRCPAMSLERLFDRLISSGASHEYIHAFLAGGANMYPNYGAINGSRNTSAIESFLLEKSIPVAERDTGGSWQRNIIFDVSQGHMEVHLKGAAG